MSKGEKEKPLSIKKTGGVKGTLAPRYSWSL